MADISTLTDDFSGTLAKWPGTYGGVTIVGGQAQIPCTSGYPALTTSTTAYNLANSGVFAKITPPPTSGPASREAYMEFYMAGNNKVSMFWANGTLYARTTTSGTNNNLWSIAYNATSHAWWKIHSTAANNVRFSTSPDGSTWTEQISSTVSFSLAALVFQFSAGYWGTEAASSMLVDNVNIGPGAGLTYAASDVVGLTDIRVSAPALARGDTLTANDSESSVSGLGRADTASLVDSFALAKSGAVALNFTDLAGLVDTPQRSVSLARGDSAGPVDLRALNAAKTLSDLLGTTDAVSPVKSAGGGRPKVWTGAGFQSKPGKVWSGTVWVAKPWKTWTGSTWKTLT